MAGSTICRESGYTVWGTPRLVPSPPSLPSQYPYPEELRISWDQPHSMAGQPATQHSTASFPCSRMGFTRRGPRQGPAYLRMTYMTRQFPRSPPTHTAK